MHLPFLTPSNKNPYFHSINVNPDSSFFDKICFPIISEKDVCSVHIMKSISSFGALSLSHTLLFLL